MRLTWYGHACFLIEGQGVKILTDPFDRSVGYPICQVEPDIVTVSHEHYDHNAVDTVLGNPVVVRGPGEHQPLGISIRGIATFHDRSGGKERGNNTVFVFDIEGIKVAHLGDLGHVLTPEQVRQMGTVDVLLLPVGGTYTIDARDAVKVVEQLDPRIVVPMHFKTPLCRINIAPVEGFLQNYDKAVKKPYLEITRKDLEGEQKVVVLDYSGK